MEIFWEGDRELTASEVRSVLLERRDVARNTVRTLLERMEDKGWLTHRTEGRTFWYRAALQRSRSIAQKVGAVLEQFCGGSPETLVSALLDYRGLTPREIDRVKALLNTVKSKTPRQE
ncbi:MAG: BlaI/MecI/CopY family transcriptional regulator [Planctomycetes bacterium]|nr:BlaI/MecI/CopY family transcriptional regulator [Planctomycetota bacterium]